MLDRDLAVLYGVETRVINQAVSRNMERFPDDFRFELIKEEVDLILDFELQDCSRSQSVILNDSNSPRGKRSRSQIVTLKRGANLKYLPYAFTEQGVAMLSSVLNSPRAVQVNIAIMRTFIRLRQILSSNAELSKKLADLEKKYDYQFKVVFDAIRELMNPKISEPKKQREIGFHTIPIQPAKNRINSKVFLT